MIQIKQRVKKRWLRFGMVLLLITAIWLIETAVSANNSSDTLTISYQFSWDTSGISEEALRTALGPPPNS